MPAVYKKGVIIISFFVKEVKFLMDVSEMSRRSNKEALAFVCSHKMTHKRQLDALKKRCGTFLRKLWSVRCVIIGNYRWVRENC